MSDYEGAVYVGGRFVDYDETDQSETQSNGVYDEVSCLQCEVAILRKQNNQLMIRLAELKDAETLFQQVRNHEKADGGVTPLLQHALKTGQEACAKVLIDMGSEIHAQCAWQRTALHIAAQQNLDAICQSLIQKSVKLNATDHKGQCPLHYAARHDSIGAAKALVEAGAIVDVRDHQRNTPLHTACAFGSYQVAKLLVASGSDAGLLNGAGQDPYDCYLTSQELSILAKSEVRECMRALFPHAHRA